jgi:hypothetical protein
VPFVPPRFRLQHASTQVAESSPCHDSAGAPSLQLERQQEDPQDVAAQSPRGDALVVARWAGAVATHVAQELIRAGLGLSLKLLEHINVTPFRHSSLQELGIFCQ